MKKRNLFIFFLILFSYFLIPISLIKGDTTHYVEDVYQVNESTDDAVYYVDFNYYDDDNFLLIKSNLYDTKTGIIFDNITIYDNATFKEVYLSLYSNDSYTDSNDYWVTLYGIDEDNSSTFSNFEDFNNRSYTSKNFNWNLKDLEGLDKWVNSTNIADIFNEIKSRSGWSSGYNIGLYILSVKSDNAYRMGMSYDGNSSYAPKLYVKYKYIISEEHEEESGETFIEYGCDGLYSIYKYVEASGLEGFENQVLYECTPQMGGGVKIGTVSHSQSETIIYSHNRYWVIGWDGEGDIRIWNSTDKQNWYGSEIEGRPDYEMLIDVTGYQYGSSHLKSVMDSEGNVHIAYKSESSVGGGYYIYYIKVELNADGTINDLGTETIYTSTVYTIQDLIVDGQDYPIVILRGDGRFRLIGSSTKGGTWVTDYNIDWSDGTEYMAELLPLGCDNGKDFVIVYTKGSNGDIKCAYFDESTETLGTLINVDTNFKTFNFGGDYLWANEYNTHSGVSIHDSNRLDNESFFTTYGWDVSEGKAEIRAYRTINGGTGWTYKTMYEFTSWSNTDYGGHLIRYNSEGDLLMIYRHNDINEGNHTFFFNLLEQANIDTNFTSTWDIEDDEICDFSGLDVDEVAEACASFSIIRGGLNEYLIDSGFVMGKDDEKIAILDVDYIQGEGGTWYRVYEVSSGDLLGTFDTLQEARDFIASLCITHKYEGLGNTISWMLGLLGLIMMPLGFVLFVSQAQKGDYSNAFLYLMICFFIGMSLFVGWLWG